MSSTNQTKTIEFGVYKYDHPNFGPLMLLLDVGEQQEKQDKKLKQPSIYRFRDEKPQQKMNIFNRYDLQDMESVDNDKKRTLSQKPPIPAEKRLNKLQIGGVSHQKIERKSLERKMQQGKNFDNGFLLPSIVKKK